MTFLPLLAGLLVGPLIGLQDGPSEADFYAVDYLPTPQDEVIEVGGMDFLSDGRLVVSTRRGQVWIITNPLADDPADATFSLYCEGLWEGLGLAVVNDVIHVVQRGELSRLFDTDGDGVCDRIETVTDAWGLSGNYHEFAFGLPRDDDGNLYVGLNLAFFSPQWWHGKSAVPWRGWVLRISPDGDATPVACGFRSPCGMGRNAAGDIFVTDNQGDWVSSSPIYHLTDGAFYSHPASLDWTDGYIASKTKASSEIPAARASERKPPAIWIPYKWSRSTGNLASDETGGRFGPFADQLFVGELTNGLVVRADLEKVRGEYQGAVMMFRRNIGSVARVAFAPDGTLFCGLTNRGWGGKTPADGIARVRWQGGVPMEMQRVHLLQDGFEVTFTHPVADDCTITTDEVDLQQYDYDYWWEYGSPERHTARVEVTGTELSGDRTRLTIRTAGLTPAMVARCVLSDVVGNGGRPLLHGEFNYTINQLPEGEATSDFVAKVVPPPPSKDSTEEGWVRLSYGDPFQLWESSGWKLCDVDLEPDDPTKLATRDGVGALVNLGEGKPSHYVSKPVFGDAEFHVEFLLPQGGNSGVYVMGRYEVQLADSAGVRDPGFSDCGGVYKGETWRGAGPAFNAFKGAGTWHDLDIRFRAPRFDADGKKTRNASFERVLLDGTAIHKDLEVPEPTLGPLFADEAATGPLLLQGDHGPVAYGNLRVKPLGKRRKDEEGWEPVFPEASFEEWKSTGNAEWELTDEGVLIGTGEMGHIFSPRADYEDFELRGRFKINDGGNSGLYFRVTPTDGWPDGYEAQINSNYPDPQKTGSLYNLSKILVHPIAENTWFDYHVTCRGTDAGTHIVIRVNGLALVDYVDTENRHARGHVGLQQHHKGSRIEAKDVVIRELK
ncbi:MAG: DUF1080 domain-containing protein [bacterium]|nr:DUF1080 domain-containing protein [bacterium]